MSNAAFMFLAMFLGVVVPYAVALLFLLKILAVEVVNRRLLRENDLRNPEQVLKIRLLFSMIGLTLGLLICFILPFCFPSLLNTVSPLLRTLVKVGGMLGWLASVLFLAISFALGEALGILRIPDIKLFRQVFSDPAKKSDRVEEGGLKNFGGGAEIARMIIPRLFYVRFWLTRSAMATATGSLLIWMLIPVPLSGKIRLLVGAAIGFSIYQAFTYKKLWGDDRGRFEYEYVKCLVDKGANKALANLIGKVELPHLYSDEFVGARPGDGVTCQSLLKDYEAHIGDNMKLLLCLRAAKIAKRKSNYDKAISFLRLALSYERETLFANYEMAVCFERLGKGDDAVASYEAALRDPNNESRALKNFISSQIERVKTEGPKKAPPVPGILYGMGR